MNLIPVYGTLALDLIEKQMDSEAIKVADVATVIEMNDVVIFDREPITNELYNKLVERRTAIKPKSHGNYIDSLLSAKIALGQDLGNETCCSSCLMEDQKHVALHAKI